MRILLVISILCCVSSFGEYFGNYSPYGYGNYGYSPYSPGYYPAPYGYGYPGLYPYYGDSDFGQFMFQLQRADQVISSVQRNQNNKAGEEMVKAGAQAAENNLKTLSQSLEANQKALTASIQASTPSSATNYEAIAESYGSITQKQSGAGKALDGLGEFLNSSSAQLDNFIYSKSMMKTASLGVRPTVSPAVYSAPIPAPRYSLLSLQTSFRAARMVASQADSVRHKAASDSSAFSFRQKPIPIEDHSGSGTSPTGF